MKKKNIIITVVCAVILIIVGILSCEFYFIPEKEFKTAIATYKACNYDKALLQFQKLDGYKNSKDYLKKCDEKIANYNKALAYYDSKEYEKAYSLLKNVGNYKKGKDYSKNCSYGIKYSEAVKDLNDCEFDSAIKAFEELGDFDDSKEKLKESKKRKKSWGKITDFKYDRYYTEDDKGVCDYETFTPEGVKKATGYECRAEIIINEDDKAVVSSSNKKIKSNNKTFYFTCIDGYEVTMYFRAYKELKTGSTIYGTWKKAENNTNMGLITSAEWKKKSEKYTSLNSCIEELDLKKADELFSKYYGDLEQYDYDLSESNDVDEYDIDSVDENVSVTKYKDADELSFTATSPVINKGDYSIYGVTDEFDSGVTSVGCIYKVKGKKHKNFYFQITSNRGGNGNYTTKADYDNHYACAYLWFPNSGTYFVDVYDDDTGDLLASDSFIVD